MAAFRFVVFVGCVLAGFFKCVLQCGETELPHAHHGLEGAPRSFGLMIFEHLCHALWHDLPREAEFVHQPSALLRGGIAARAELIPESVHFLLHIALDLEGDGFVELEDRPANERGEGLAIQFKLRPTLWVAVGVAS